MQSKLFAFNVAQGMPAGNTVHLVGAYDDQQQMWIGSDPTAYIPTDTNTSGTTSTSTCTEKLGSCYEPPTTDGDTSPDLDTDRA